MTKISDAQIRKVEAYINNSQDALTASERVDNLHVPAMHFTVEINNLLRANITPTNAIPFLQELDAAFVDKTNTDQTVYRCFNYLEMVRYINDGTYIDFGYMSTSRKKETAITFAYKPQLGYSPAFLKIKIPAGSNVLDLNLIEGLDNTTYEQEVLIKRGSKFKITNNELMEDRFQKYLFRSSPYLEKVQMIELDFEGYLPSLPL